MLKSAAWNMPLPRKPKWCWPMNTEARSPQDSGGTSESKSQVQRHVIRFGDLYMVDWSPGRGSEQTGTRPAVIVQNNPFNSNHRYPNTIAVTVSISGRDVPTHVHIPKS